MFKFKINKLIKQYSYIALLIIFTFFCYCCGGGDDINPEDQIKENTAPTIPSQVFPLNNTICADNNLVFQWNPSTDAESNRVTYLLEVSENNSFTPIVYTETSSSESKLISLNKGKVYYWRIKAIDSQSAESEYSSVSQFFTEGEGDSNHLPFTPILLTPALDSEIDGTNTTLSWLASDVDGDSMIFDVYLDTSSELTTIVSENQSETNYNASNLIPSTKYYFKVIVKDDKGGITIGQKWGFTTQ